jgi:RHS repeat-associated protein
VSPNSGNVTTTTNGDLLLGAVLTGNTANFTVGSGYTIEETVPAEPNTKLIAEDRIQAVSGSASASATLGVADHWAAALVAFKAAGGGSTAPSITSANNTALTVGTAGTFTVTTTGSPAPTLSESGALPGGVSFNASTGVLSGTPVAGTAEIYPIKFTAHNGIGSDATQNFMLTVNNLASGAVYYYFADQLGTSRVITDSSGTVCYDADFYPFGGERAYATNCDPDYKFSSKERDSESGLDNFGARYDSSQYGRFMTPDWASGASAVPYADFSNPQSLNLYSYVKNNPLTLTDPDGHCDVDGEHHWGWCLWHDLGFYQTQVDRANDARNFFDNNLVTINGTAVDQTKMSDKQVLAAFRAYNDAYRDAGGCGAPCLAALLPGAGLQYEPNPKHGSTAQGNISAEPRNPKATLENSVPVKNTSTARVGVDPSTGEYVMFRETRPGVYHGYATSNFNDLPNEAKAALQDAGLVSQRGKIR